MVIKKTTAFKSPIYHGGRIYTFLAHDPMVSAKKAAQSQEQQGNKTLILVVSNPRLKGKTDLHGNPYKPSEHLFISSTK